MCVHDIHILQKLHIKCVGAEVKITPSQTTELPMKIKCGGARMLCLDNVERFNLHGSL